MEIDPVELYNLLRLVMAGIIVVAVTMIALWVAEGWTWIRGRDKRRKKAREILARLKAAKEEHDIRDKPGEVAKYDALMMLVREKAEEEEEEE